MKLIYTRPDDNGVSIVTAASKEHLERVLGPLSDKQYLAEIYKSIPDTALKIREISDTDIPADREFRDAWCDVTDLFSIDIDNKKVKEIELGRMRVKRNAALDLLDKVAVQVLEDGADLAPVRIKKQALRDATEPLKALNVSGINDEAEMKQIKALAVLPE